MLRGRSKNFFFAPNFSGFRNFRLKPSKTKSLFKKASFDVSNTSLANFLAIFWKECGGEGGRWVQNCPTPHSSYVHENDFDNLHPWDSFDTSGVSFLKHVR